MDAHALLTKQGWRGTGNSLHPTNNSIGLAKPLLVGRKNDKIGLGKKAHQTSDMWWMHAFDESLKALNTTREGTSVKSSPSTGGLEAIKRGAGKWILANGGLYANFIKGTSLAGTMLQVANKSIPIITSKKKAPESPKSTLQEGIADPKIAKTDISRLKKSEKRHETREQKKARKAEKRLLREKSSLKSTSSATLEEKQTKSIELATNKSKRKRKREQKSENITIEELSKDQCCETLQKKKKRSRLKK